MPDTPPNPQFWLLTGEVPSGPFSVNEIHAKIAAGDATWQTPACPVGGSTWLPIVRTSGLGPGAAGVPSPASEPTAGAVPNPLPLPTQQPATEPPTRASATPPPLPVTPNPPREPATPAAPAAPPPAPTAPKYGRAAIGVAVLLVLAGVGYGVYWAYERLRPPTATEVCKKLDAARTAAEAKPYATPRMHPLLDALFADGTGLDPNDTSEWTQEVDGPRPDTKRVGFRGTTLVPEAGRRVRVEGHFVAVKADGWKVDDVVLTGVEGAALPGPVSLVEEHAPPATARAACRRLNAAKTAAEAKKYATARMHPLVDTLAADRSASHPDDAFEITQEADGGEPGTRRVGFRGSWYDPQAARRVAVEGHFRVVSAGGWKVDDLLVTAVEGAALPRPMSLVDEHRRSTPPAPKPSPPPLKDLPQWAKGPAIKLTPPAPRPWYEIDEKSRLRLAAIGGVLGLGGLARLVAHLRQKYAGSDRTT